MSAEIGGIMGYQVIIKKYQGSVPTGNEVWPLDFMNEREMCRIKNFQDFPIRVNAACTREKDVENWILQAEMMGQMNEPISISLEYVQENWNRKEYVFFPAAVYDGNRMDSVCVPYPPYHDGKKGEAWAQVVTDIPRLSTEGGESGIQLRSGDMSTPAMGFYNAETNEGAFILAKHQIHGRYTGFSLFEKEDQAAFRVSLPAVRERKKYFFGELPDGSGFYPTMNMESDDEGFLLQRGERLKLEVKIYHITAKSRIDYFRQFNQLRETVEKGEDFSGIPFSAAYQAVKGKYIEHNFDTEGYYRVGSGNDTIPSYWQAGWVGGGMNSYPILMEDEGTGKRQALCTLEFIARKLQFENGWYVPMYAKGRRYGDAFTDGEEAVLLVRKDADLLYFLLKQAMFLRKKGEEPEYLTESIRRQADAFVRFIKKNGQLGQFIDVEKEEILAGNTASAAISPAALALAYEFFGDSGYLETAELLGDEYLGCLQKGIMNGGPGEICQAPDSESAFGFLEACVQLYETTGKEKWLKAAEEAFELAVTWVMSYDFSMPSDSTAAQLGVHTRGTVFANAQNKHSAPGICTLSGNSMLKLYRFTGQEKYLTWMKRISHALSQFVSMPDRPIQTLAKKLLPEGWYNERVQTSDWEGKETIGEFLYGSNWPEVSMLLTYVEVPGIYVDMKNRRISCQDHVSTECEWSFDGALHIKMKNTTHYAAEVTIMEDYDNNRKLGHGYFKDMKRIKIPAGEEKIYEIKRIGL